MKIGLHLFGQSLKISLILKRLFWAHAECILFIGLRNNEPVGRIAAIIDYSLAGESKTTIGFFGFFEF
jgi:hypothetical protein